MQRSKKNKQIPRPLSPIKGLIVEDEIGAINTLRAMLKEYCPQVSICGIATTVEDAIKMAAKKKPDLVFLDIEMPPLGSGFDFLKNSTYSKFGVIFTTAYPQYAIEAINATQPWAYLVKPYSVAELRDSVNTAYEKWKKQVCFDFQTAGMQRVIVHDSRKGKVVFRADAIVYCKAAGGFTEIYIYRNKTIEKVVSSNNLGEYESEFPKVLFTRTHHSFLVNMAYVKTFERTGRNGTIHLSIPHDQQVEVSISKVDQFKIQLEEFCQLRVQ